MPNKPRFVVRPSDACGTLANAARDRSWDVIDTQTDRCVANYDRRLDARAEAKARNAH